MVTTQTQISCHDNQARVSQCNIKVKQHDLCVYIIGGKVAAWAGTCVQKLANATMKYIHVVNFFEKVEDQRKN